MRLARRVALLAAALAPAALAALAAASAAEPDRALEAARALADLEMSAEPVARSSLAASVAQPPERHPFDGFTPSDLLRILHESPAQLGPASVGQPNRGALFNGVQLVSTPYLEVVSPMHAWGTASTVAAIDRAARAVSERFPGGHPLHVGDISARRGGFLRPHRSHQSGLDADLGYYYRDGSTWYAPATAANLDRARTWALIVELIQQGEVEYLFIDRSVQELLREHAEQRGTDPVFLASVFGSEQAPGGVVRHTWGHMSHFHVRFADPVARETGRRLHGLLKRTGKLWR